VVETEVTVGAVVSVVVVVSAVLELELLDEAQEMIVRLKQEIRIMNKTFFIFSSIPKVKILLDIVLGEPYMYHNLGEFTRMWGFYLEGV